MKRAILALALVSMIGCVPFDGYYYSGQRQTYYRGIYTGYNYSVLVDAERQAAAEFSCPEVRVIRSNYYYQNGIRLNVCGSLVCYEWLGFRGNRNVFNAIPCNY